jgi:hypothetical protein
MTLQLAELHGAIPKGACAAAGEVPARVYTVPRFAEFSGGARDFRVCYRNAFAASVGCSQE